MRIKIKDKVYEVDISEFEGEGVKITVNGKEFLFEEKGGGQEKISLANVSLPKRNFSKKEIIAPISGLISEIFVKKGDIITRGQKILVISAMKMENELISEFEGRIKEILVNKNQEVRDGDALIVLQ